MYLLMYLLELSLNKTLYIGICTYECYISITCIPFFQMLVKAILREFITKFTIVNSVYRFVTQ